MLGVFLFCIFCFLLKYKFIYGFPNGSVGKESNCNVGDTGDLGLIPELGRAPAEGNGNPFQCSCLKNPMDSGAWWATVLWVAKHQTRLSD